MRFQRSGRGCGGGMLLSPARDPASCFSGFRELRTRGKSGRFGPKKLSESPQKVPRSPGRPREVLKGGTQENLRKGTQDTPEEHPGIPRRVPRRPPGGVPRRPQKSTQETPRGVPRRPPGGYPGDPRGVPRRPPGGYPTGVPRRPQGGTQETPTGVPRRPPKGVPRRPQEGTPRFAFFERKTC